MINIKGAREHNLDRIDLALPQNRLICFTGVSGSGKSSLAFDTLYAEGQRRYIESLSSYARQFLGQLPKPDVEYISGLSPAISISQKSGGQNPRSTVGTVTEIYDFLRLLFARVSTGYCPQCGRPVTAQTRSQVLDRLVSLPENTAFLVLAPVVKGQKGEFRDLFADLKKRGFLRARVDGELIRLEEDLRIDRQQRHTIEVVIDRIVKSQTNHHRLAEAVESAMAAGKGEMIVLFETAPEEDAGGADGEKPAPRGKKAPRPPKEILFSSEYACPYCGISFPPPTPQLFSFNNPQGMCPHCSGQGYTETFDEKLLIPDPSRSFQQGCIEPIGRWREMGRWLRNVFQGVSDAVSKRDGLDKNHILETAWEELEPKYRRLLLYGDADLQIPYSWQGSSGNYRWADTYKGVIPLMLKQYKDSSSKAQRQAMEKYMTVAECAYCGGRRLNEQACAYRLDTSSRAARFRDRPSLTLPDLCALPISDLIEFLQHVVLDATKRKIAGEALKEILARLGFLRNVGLDYLTLGRTAPTLSGGEIQRIRLASQIGSGLTGVMYILDEPSIGLHARDNRKLIETLRRLRDIGNTVIVVEHDEETMLAADWLVDFGPGPGVEGGKIVAQGSVADVLSAEKTSLTARFLSGAESIPVPAARKKPSGKKLVIRGAAQNNLKNIDVEIPLGCMICVTGVSGSGKSSLVNDILVEVLNRDLNHGIGNPGAYRAIEGIKHLDKMIAIDQSPIGRTPRSNPSTYIKLFDEIRKLFANLPESRTKGFLPGRFSFNVSGGRCEACEGNGAKKLEMDFLADIWVQCPVCEGKRFNRDTLSVTFKGCTINDILDMDVDEALVLFENYPKIAHKLKTLRDVGLGYMKLGQPSPTLSGGEAQRIKLARELVKKPTGKTLYLLDEPTTGLHFADIRMLLNVLRSFVDQGNTVLVVEHNLDVVKTADWIIDLGPEGGEAGGRVVAAGTPEEIMANPDSLTGRCLREHLGQDRAALKKPKSARAKGASQTRLDAQSEAARSAILVRGAREHNLQNISLDIPRERISVCSGMSGSGKTSLAMDTVYAEGQRRFVESLSSYARQFLGQMPKPDVDQVIGVSPAIAIQQKTGSHSPRSTVGTITEIHDYLRVLFARLGVPYCPDCDVPVGTQSTDEIVEKVLALLDERPTLITAPVSPETTDYPKLWERLRKQGFVRVRIDGALLRLEEIPEIDRRRRHQIEVVADRILLSGGDVEALRTRGAADAQYNRVRSRLAGSVESALALGKGVLRLVRLPDDPSDEEDDGEITLSQHLCCPECGRSFERLLAHHFSFNSPLGWCPHCEGLGTEIGTVQSNVVKEPKRSLREGALDLWPAADAPYAAGLLTAFCRQTGIPADQPFEQLDARHRRLLFHGTGDRWLALTADDMNPAVKPAGRKSSAPVLLRFQYKGLYPAIDEAARLVPSLRSRFLFQVKEVECSACMGSRLREDAAAVRFHSMTIDQINRRPLEDLLAFFKNEKFPEREKKIAGEIIGEIRKRLEFLTDVGLGYLTLARPAASLSGGESQRIRLAAQIGSGLTGVLYVLDEPTVGLHPRDNSRLIGAIRKLRDLGNTVLMVEHDKQIIESADNVFDFGPRAGREGGEIVASGSPEDLPAQSASVTGPFLSSEKTIPIPINRRILR
ncbi:MAG: excinuclease ABC subunit UvrA [Thermoguttaceae bacterium]|nr:excinuclease ABC subunit UvrA [Thermoguttaceae bacterium]